MKQGVYQLKLLAESEPIEMALRSKELDPKLRQKLELIIDVREFAGNRLRLKADRNYKDVNLSWKHIIHTVSASEALKFKSYHWWFPIIGSVPYKGYFNKDDAINEENRLKALGYETQNGRIYGYSTLGYFSDPVWPIMLRLDDEDLIELIIHELAHATVYFPNQTPFNETFANFVGKMGARAFLRERYGENSRELASLKEHQAQTEVHNEFFYNLYLSLDKLYKSDQNDEEKKLGKRGLLKSAEHDYALMSERLSSMHVDWAHVNNAYLLSFKRYNYDEEVFRKLFTIVGGDFQRFLDDVQFYGNARDPFMSLRQRIDALARKS